MAETITIKKGKASISLTGLGDLYRALRKVSHRAQEEGIKILNSAGGRVFSQSQEQVPVGPAADKNRGALKRSGRLYRARVSKRSGRVYATITYGGSRLTQLAPGENPIYAIVQHEDMGLKHTQGSAKFLERPFLQAKAGVMAGLEGAIRKAVEGA